MKGRGHARGATRVGPGVGARLSYANVMATVSAFLALGGGGFALASHLEVRSSDIVANAVRSRHVKDNAVQLRDLRSVKAWNRNVPVSASAANSGDALAAATKVRLARRGSITIYGKCYANSSLDAVFAGVFVRTSIDGALSRTGAGQPQRIDTTTPEGTRSIGGGSAATNDEFGFSDPAFETRSVLSGDHKLALSVTSHSVTKNGDPAIGPEPLGAGDRCSFSGYAIG